MATQPYLDEEFSEAVSGYLSSPADRLPIYERRAKEILERRAISLDIPRHGHDGRLLSAEKFIHYRSIYHAICWGIRNPAQWDAVRQPVKLTKRLRFEGVS